MNCTQGRKPVSTSLAVSLEPRLTTAGVARKWGLPWAQLVMASGLED